MNLLKLENVSKSYGEKILFDRISLLINQGDKIGLVARNGSGKSTLLRVLAGLEAPEGETSQVWMHKEVRLQYLGQEPELDDQHTILEAVFDTDDPILTAISQYEEALLLNRSNAEIEAASLRMDDLKAWDAEARIQEVLSKLKIDELQKRVKHLSGGERKRLALAKMIVENGDFLILDEPTNHLDLDMIEWLEEYLSQAGKTLVMVTHDRYFLERVCDQIYELEGGQLFRYAGNYSDYLEKKATRTETQRSESEKDRKLLKKELEWVRRMPKARGTKAKSRVQAAEKLQDKVANIRKEKELEIDLKGKRLGKKILEAHHISKAFEDRTLIEDFSYKFRKGERAGIVGPNGSGKSTLLNLLTQQIRPDKGKVVVGENTQFGFYTQQGIESPGEKKVIDFIRDVAEYIPLEKGQKLTAEQLLERFLFSRKQQQVRVSELSGGEKRRLFLLSILMQNPNFLILDEPTNDLDILTLNILEDFLMDFPGCILIVSHDRYFMDKIVEHLFVFEGDGQVRDFPGGYTAYRQTRKEEERQEREQARSRKTEAKTEGVPVPRDQGLSRDQQKELKRLEKEIKKLEEKKSGIQERFLEGISDSGEIERLSKEIKQLESEIEAKEGRWMELVELT